MMEKVDILTSMTQLGSTVKEYTHQRLVNLFKNLNSSVIKSTSTYRSCKASDFSINSILVIRPSLQLHKNVMR